MAPFKDAGGTAAGRVSHYVPAANTKYVDDPGSDRRNAISESDFTLGSTPGSDLFLIFAGCGAELENSHSGV